MDKWGQFIIHKNKELPYKETLELKFLYVLKVTHILVDNLNLALYMRVTSEAKQFFMAKIALSHKLAKDKVLYIYMREWCKL